MSYIALILAYLIGAIPTGILIARARGVSIQDQGSGNVGTANVTRVLGWNAGILTLLADSGKGMAGVIIARLLTDDALLAAWGGFAAALGHCFSIPGIWRGGKGVATSFGALLLLTPLIAVLSGAVYGAVTAISRVSALGSLAAAFTAPLLALFFEVPRGAFPALLAMTVLIVIRHQANIERMISGKWD